MRMTRRGVLLVLLVVAAAKADASEILIGVISPTGPGRSVGIAHEETARFAFERFGTMLNADGIAVPLRIEYRSDHGDPAVAVAEARSLVEAGAVAILGPVDSSSTRDVLRAGLEVPVLSALSTAPSLSNPRDPWFFRVTLDDGERMRQYAQTLRRYDDMMPAPVLVLYDGSNPYGEGLWAGLREALGFPETSAHAWSELVDGGTVTDGNRELVRKGDAFNAAASAALLPPSRTIFVLGGSRDAVAIAQGVKECLRNVGITTPPRFFFVGADSEIRGGAPENSFTIGDPTVVDGNGGGVGNERAEFARERKLDPENFIVTAYEAAYYVLPGALTEVLRTLPRGATSDGRSHEGFPPVQELRRQLRAKLEETEFQSMEPGRRFRLAEGRMSAAPAVPVYRVARRLDLVDILDPKPWLDVDAPAQVGFLEGPVTMRLHTHWLLAKELAVDLLRVDVIPNQRVPSELHAVSDDEAQVSFYPRLPWASYRVQPRRALPTLPPEPVTRVRLGYAYPVALAGSLLGSVLFVLAVTERGVRVRRHRIALGVVTGLALAVLEFHEGALPAAISIPRLAASPGLNAFWAGFAGGWSGPGILMFFLTRLMPGGSAAPAPDHAPEPAPLPSPEPARPH